MNIFQFIFRKKNKINSTEVKSLDSHEEVKIPILKEYIPDIRDHEDINPINFTEIEKQFNKPVNCPFMEHCPIMGTDVTEENFEYDCLSDDNPLRIAYIKGYDQGWEACEDENDFSELDSDETLSSMVNEAMDHLYNIRDEELDNNNIHTELMTMERCDEIDNHDQDVVEEANSFDNEKDEDMSKNDPITQHAFKVRSVIPIDQPLKDKEDKDIPVVKYSKKSDKKQIRSITWEDGKRITTFTDGSVEYE